MIQALVSYETDSYENKISVKKISVPLLMLVFFDIANATLNELEGIADIFTVSPLLWTAGD